MFNINRLIITVNLKILKKNTFLYQISLLLVNTFGKIEKKSLLLILNNLFFL